MGACLSKIEKALHYWTQGHGMPWILQCSDDITGSPYATTRQEELAYHVSELKSISVLVFDTAHPEISVNINERDRPFINSVGTNINLHDFLKVLDWLSNLSALHVEDSNLLFSGIVQDSDHIRSYSYATVIEAVTLKPGK